MARRGSGLARHENGNVRLGTMRAARQSSKQNFEIDQGD
jgi:hypothetical protein